MANKVIVSKRWSLNLRDWLKTALLTVGVPMLYEVQRALDAGSFNIDWKRVAMIGISAGTLYLIKQLTGAPKVTTVYKTNDKAVDVAKDIK